MLKKTKTNAMLRCTTHDVISDTSSTPANVILTTFNNLVVTKKKSKC